MRTLFAATLLALAVTACDSKPEPTCQSIAKACMGDPDQLFTDQARMLRFASCLIEFQVCEEIGPKAYAAGPAALEGQPEQAAPQDNASQPDQ